MEKIHGKSVDLKAVDGVRLSIPLHDGFSMTVTGGKLELNLPASALGDAFITQTGALPPPSQYCSIGQEAERLGISERTLRTYMHEKDCPFYRLPGGDVRLTSSEVDLWMAQRKVGGKK